MNPGGEKTSKKVKAWVLKIPFIEHHESVKAWLRRRVREGQLSDEEAREIFQKWLRRRRQSGR